MQDVPKIVRERLKAIATPVDHPDANVLTAFAERSLPDSERTAVTVHLSRCVDCRDIVALALPPVEAAQPVITPARSGWLTWPALRWGFVAVGVVAIASVGVLKYQQRGEATHSVAVSNYVDSHRAASEAQKQTPPMPSSTTSAREVTPPAPTSFDKGLARSLAHGEHAKATNEVDTGESRKASPHLAQRGANAGGSAQGYVAGGPMVAWQQQGVQQQQIPGANTTTALQVFPRPSIPAAAPNSSADQTARVAPRPSAPEKQTQSDDVTLAKNQPAGQDAAEILRAKPSSPQASETVEVSAAAPMTAPIEDKDSQEMPKVMGDANGRSVTVLPALRPRSNPRWTITSTGSLQRSYDQGGTWQDVNVMAGLIATPSLDAYGASVGAVMKTKKEARIARKRDVPVPAFRVVTAAGSEVWAGGSNAALYHSTDGGDHWMQVLPSSDGMTLAGDIVALEFPDSQHGRVTTSNPEVWTTSDAGQTWQKQ